MMTSISSGASYAPQSPTKRLQTFLQSEVSAGTVKSADATALSSAISDIGQALQASGSTATGSATPSTPVSMKDKIDNAIDQEVKDGKLTEDQATELKKVFADASQKLGKAHGGGHHHHHVESGSDTDTDATASVTGTTPTDPTTATASGGDIGTMLSNFLKTLQSTLSGNSVYNATGSQSSTLQSMLVDTNA